MIVTKAKIKFVGSPNVLAAASPPPIFVTATGINVKPIVVITVPVTIGGNNFSTLEKKPEISTTKTPAAIIEP